MNAFTRSAVKREGPSSGQIQAQARRSLEFLQTIENTVTTAEADVKFLRAMTAEIDSMLQILSAAEPAAPLDPDGRTSALLCLASEGAMRMYHRAIARRQSARADDRLTDDDGVVDCLTDLIAALADFHNMIETVRDAIETLDALHSPSLGRVFTDVDAMLAHLTH